MPHQDDIVVVAVFCIFVFRIERQIDNSWCCLSVCYVAVSTLFVVKCFCCCWKPKKWKLKNENVRWCFRWSETKNGTGKARGFGCVFTSVSVSVSLG